MAKKYYVDKNYVLGTLSARQKTVSDFVKEIGCSRVNFYQALNRAYTKPRSLFMSKIISALNLDERLVWQDE